MTPKDLVHAFYADIWNDGDLSRIDDLLAKDLIFRGSLGPEMRGRDSFRDYVAMVRGALADYRCDIEDLVCEGERAFARMLFSGRHVAEFMGFPATGRTVEWSGAALFTCADARIVSLWVLGDVHGLIRLLQAQSAEESSGG